MCLADKGSGLPCPQKLEKLRELAAEFEQGGKEKVDYIKAVGSQVINIVSNLESQQVEEQVSILKFLTLYFVRFFVILLIPMSKCFTDEIS